MTKRRFTSLLVTGLCLLVLCGCTGTTAPQGQSQTALQDGEASSSAETESRPADQGVGFGFAAGRPSDPVQTVQGLQVVSGAVVKMSRNAMHFAPVSSAGTFAINGRLSADSEIAFCINPTGILNYKLTLNVDEDKEVKAEIRVYKDGAQLASHVQEGVLLQAGECDVDACIDTGEKTACTGMYTIRFYIDDCCVSETTNYV